MQTLTQASLASSQELQKKHANRYQQAAPAYKKNNKV
jgi:hypothetical protein